MSGRSESRRSQRFPINTPLRYRVFGEGEWRRGRTVNISSSGVFFRCPHSADRGARVELNFVLLSSRAKEPGLEVECKGEIVRLENLANGDSQAALAVRISDYRLLPLLASRSNLEDPFKKPEGQN
jgi:PilZ domain